MSNFKEIYPQTNFREDLHRMDSLGKDDYEVWAYNGDPDSAPLSADYVYQLQENTNALKGRQLKITNGIYMPITSFKLYGQTHNNLPDEYTELCYIKSNGNQWIDTEYQIDELCDEIETDIVFTRNTGTNVSRFPFGTYAVDSYYGLNFHQDYLGNSKILVYYNSGGGRLTYTYDGTGEKTNVKFSLTNVYINDYNIGALPTTGKIKTKYNLYLFAASTLSGSVISSVFRSTMELWTFKIWHSGILVRNFIPCRRKLDNKLGLYDTVEDKFYGPAIGSQDFIAGPEITASTMDNPIHIKNAGTWNPSTNYYEIKCKNKKGLNLIKDSATKKLEHNGQVTGTATRAVTMDSSFVKENYAGRTVTYSYDCWVNNMQPLNSELGSKRCGMEFAFHTPEATSTKYYGKWFNAPIDQLNERAYYTFVIPASWDGELPESNYYIQRIVSGDIKMSRPKMELGDTPTPYVPHSSEGGIAEDIDTIYSPQPLSSLQNGVRDYYDNGWLYLSTVYDYFRPTDNWQIENSLSNNNVMVISLFVSNAIKQSIDIYCSHFEPSETLSQPNKIKIDNQRIYISVDRNSYPDLDSVLRWMSENTVFICYQRKNTLKVASEPAVLLYSYDEVTNIINDQNAEMEIEYRIAPNARIWERQEDGAFRELTS